MSAMPTPVPTPVAMGMEHRNSSVVAERTSIRGAAASVFGTVAHEFFHCWNVERIRPLSLEPFNFEAANISGELWLAEGFTQYLRRPRHPPRRADAARSRRRDDGELRQRGDERSGRRVHSAVEMSELAPFTDAATAIDRTNFSNTFISDYTRARRLPWLST